jgi:hypothetical protein
LVAGSRGWLKNYMTNTGLAIWYPMQGHAAWKVACKDMSVHASTTTKNAFHE